MDPTTTTAESLPSTLKTITLAVQLYEHRKALENYLPEEVPPFTELTPERQEMWKSLAVLAWQESQPSGLPELREEAYQDRQALDRIEEILAEFGVDRDGSWIPDIIARLLKELEDRREQVPIRTAPNQPITLEPAPASVADDATVLPPKLTEAVAGLLVQASKVGGIRVDVVLGRAAQAEEDLKGALDELAEGMTELAGDVQRIAVKQRQTDRCGHREGHSSACSTERRDFENPLYSCGWSSCPHRQAGGS